ncbi:hypothetical protein C6P41_004160 [Kluyveromyces marxianus]|nr:hypothetical protein C6P41_004160 [Kluyveromyces marxianus]
MNKSSLGVIKKKKSNLKRLTGVLKDLLVKESSPKSEEDQDYKTPPKTRKDGALNTSIWNEEEDTNQDSKLIKEAEVEEEEFLEEPDSDNDYTSESYHNIARER